MSNDLGQSSNRAPFLTTSQTVFIASMIALDFAFGMVMKNLLAPTPIRSIIRIEMVLPVLLLLTTRKVVDRFGVLTLYMTVWGLLAIFAMPNAFGIPGILKLVPAITQGLILDLLMSAFSRWHRTRFIVSAIAGHILSFGTIVLFKLALGMPNNTLVQAFFGIQMGTGILVHLTGALLALVVWERIKHNPIVGRIAFAPNR